MLKKYIINNYFTKLFCFNSMSAAIDFSKYIKGEPVKVVVRIRPPTNFQKEDIRINNSTIILTDQNNRGFKD